MCEERWSRALCLFSSHSPGQESMLGSVLKHRQDQKSSGTSWGHEATRRPDAQTAALQKDRIVTQGDRTQTGASPGRCAKVRDFTARSIATRTTGLSLSSLLSSIGSPCPINKELDAKTPALLGHSSIISAEFMVGHFMQKHMQFTNASPTRHRC